MADKKCSEYDIKKDYQNILKEKNKLIEENIRLGVEVNKLKKQVMTILSHDEDSSSVIFPEITGSAVIHTSNFDGVEYYKIRPTDEAFDVDIMRRKGGVSIPLTSMKFEVDTGPMSKKIEEKLKKKVEYELKEKFKQEFKNKEARLRKEISKLEVENEEKDVAIGLYKKLLKKRKKLKCEICHGTITTGGIECIKCKREGLTARCYICDDHIAEWKERGMPCLINPKIKISQKDIIKL